MPNPVTPLPGNKFYLLVGDGATPTEAFTFLCIADTIQSQHEADIEDAMIMDCDDPTAIPTLSSAVKSLAWNLQASGLVDTSKAGYVRLRTQFRAGLPVNIQLKKNLAGASGGETEMQAFLIASWSEEKQANGIVKCNWQFRGQGKPTITANA